MKKFICILISLLSIFCLSNVVLATSKNTKAKKVNAPVNVPKIQKATKIKITSGAETKDSYIIDFYDKTFFTVPFEAKMPKLPIAMEMKCFGYYQEGDVKLPEEVESGDTLKPGFVYAMRIKNDSPKEYYLILNPLSTKKTIQKNTMLDWEETNKLIVFLCRSGSQQDDAMLSYCIFNEAFSRSMFMFVSLPDKLKKNQQATVAFRNLSQEKFDQATYTLMGLTQPATGFIEIHKIFVEKPFFFYENTLDTFLFRDILIQDTVSVNSSEKNYPTYYIMILGQKNEMDNAARDTEEPAMSQAEKIIKEIAKRMIYDREISEDCVIQEEGDARAMISVEPLNVHSGEINTFVVTGGNNSCCQGARRCGSWVYERIDDEENGYKKLLGPFLADDVKVTKYTSNEKRDIAVTFPGGLSYPEVIEYYRFDGENYYLFKKVEQR